MGLKNEDFRKLMRTPRPGADNSSSSSTTATSMAASLAKKAAQHPSLVAKPKSSSNGTSSKSKKSSMKKKRKPNPAYEEMKRRQQELAEKYRDRAAERRKGIDDESFVSAAELEQLVSANANNPMFTGNEAVDAEARRQMRQKEIEQSKYLGGDISRTHLVKGLDFALLEKTRRENQTGGVNQASNSKAKSILKTDPDPAPTEAEFTTRLGRSIFQTLFPQEEPKSQHHLFAPGYMKYELSLSQSDKLATMNDVPRAIIRARAEMDHANLGRKRENKQQEKTSEFVLSKLVDIMANLRSSAANKRKKGKLKTQQQHAPHFGRSMLASPTSSTTATLSASQAPTAAPRSSAEVTDEDVDAADMDIFADVDEYTARVDRDESLNRRRRVRFAEEPEVRVINANSTKPLPLDAVASRGGSDGESVLSAAVNDLYEDDPAQKSMSLSAARDALLREAERESVDGSGSGNGRGNGDEDGDGDGIDDPSSIITPLSDEMLGANRKKKKKTGGFADAINGSLDAYDEYFPGDDSTFFSGVLGADSDDEGDDGNDDDDDEGNAKQRNASGKEMSNRKLKAQEKKRMDKDMKMLDSFLKKRGSSGLYDEENVLKKGKYADALAGSDDEEDAAD